MELHFMKKRYGLERMAAEVTLLTAALFFSSLASISIVNYGFIFKDSYAISSTGAADNVNTNKNTNMNTLPKLTIYWGINHQKSEVLKARQIELVLPFDNVIGVDKNTTIKDPSFSFTVPNWPLMSPGDHIRTAFSANVGNNLQTLSPSSVKFQLVNILNPANVKDATAGNLNNFDSLKIGTTIKTLPLLSINAGKNRDFLVSSNISSGYYLVNVLVKFPDQSYTTVYTGKVMVESASSTIPSPGQERTNGVASPGQTPPKQKPGPPDKDCLFNPSLPKCASSGGKCPEGFLTNEEGQCVPLVTKCPQGFHTVDEDETGTCYPDANGCPDGTLMDSLSRNCQYAPALSPYMGTSCPPGYEADEYDPYTQEPKCVKETDCSTGEEFVIEESRCVPIVTAPNMATSCSSDKVIDPSTGECILPDEDIEPSDETQNPSPDEYSGGSEEGSGGSEEGSGGDSGSGGSEDDTGGDSGSGGSEDD
jgi:uncharacterized membrane protein YgcG